jgi:hypothetical protein
MENWRPGSVGPTMAKSFDKAKDIFWYHTNVSIKYLIGPLRYGKF